MLTEALYLGKLETPKSTNSKQTVVFSNDGMLLAMRVNNLAIGNKKTTLIGRANVGSEIDTRP